MASGWGMGASNNRCAAAASAGWIFGPLADRAGRLPLLVIATALSAILAGCSHAPSSNYTAAAQSQPQAQSLAASPTPALAAAEPTSPRQPDQYEQALTSAYPSESLVDVVKRSPDRPAPVQTAGSPPPAAGVPAPMAGQPLALDSSTAASPPAAMAGHDRSDAQPGSTPAVASVPGSAPAAAATAAPAPQPNQYDQALTAAYPSMTLGDLFRSAGDPASR